MFADEQLQHHHHRLPASFPSRPWGEHKCSADLPSLSMHVGVVREMLSTLETLTASGQGYLMAKLGAFIKNQLGKPRPGVGRRDQDILTELLTTLAHESEQQWPDARLFRDCVERLMTRLA